MIRQALAALALAGLAGCVTAEPAAPPYADHSQAFVDFVDRTAALAPEARLAAFKQDVAPLYPGFYAPRDGATQAQFEARVLRAIEQFPRLRERYVATQRAFPQAIAAARRHFRETFPDSDASMPIYFLHSLGEMDGGTREIGGRRVLIFGADGIASYHSPDSLGPFFDHEFFHVEHGAYFTECEQVWCALWTEGLATAAAEAMNPGASQAALMLTVPRPIAPEVDANWREALCYLRTRQDSTAPDDYKAMFYGNGGTATLPPRWGYYVGYRLAQRRMRGSGLVELAHLGNAAAETLVKAELAAMSEEAGGC